MTKVLTVTNQKGGVGKTTTTVNLASTFKHRGYRVLVIDMDPQGNSSFCINADNVLNATIYEVLKGEVRMQYAIQRTTSVDIVSANILLSGVEMEFTSSGREFLLRDAIAPIKEFYDVIIIDTPPGLGVLTINAMTASDGIIIPMVPDIFSLQGITQLNDTVNQIKKHSNPNLKIEGVVLNKYDRRYLLSREVKGAADLILKDLNIPIFKTLIHSSIAVTEAQSSQKELHVYAKNNKVIKDFYRLSKEILVGD